MVSTGAAAGHGAEFAGFTGEWLSGSREVPMELSLGLVCRYLKVEVVGPAARPWWARCQASKAPKVKGLTTPDLDLGDLGPVCWSKNSCTAYYVNAQEDAERTRDELVRLLAFAVEVKAAGVPPDAVVDFAPAVRARRLLLHCLTRDLGLASVSVGDDGEKLVRVSRATEAAAAADHYERELLESSGGGGEDLHEYGDENPISSFYLVVG
ncbi:hypothetical protein INS49_006001 [Diaporthe citri]|uniref:uncharacterized protein n=1 Tax=Diaporthe citri TaxID=83186 RepID=UPI001C80AFF1|nr:uncharacterized protein INS49_006001 [Diaporthe citri]KAG6364400.1 hypothetical protein INS49_006001 [Diaporthe citri]